MKVSARTSINHNLRQHGAHGWAWDQTSTFLDDRGQIVTVKRTYRTSTAGRGLYCEEVTWGSKPYQVAHPSCYSLRGLEFSLVAAKVGVDLIDDAGAPTAEVHSLCQHVKR